MKSIGVIHTSFTDKKGAPIQSARSEHEGIVEVDFEYSEGLDGIEGFSHIYLLYGFHCSEQNVSLKVQPFLDDQLHGVFSTRYPCRPNPLGLSIVQLIKRQGNLLYFRGADMLDGTPLFDIKPYIPDFDIFNVEKIGWYKSRKYLWLMCEL
jgi:tRNA-Thr(GGU) m(6)t(6)A37 methyltransferase TsaA